MPLTAQATGLPSAPPAFPLTWDWIETRPGLYECNNGRIVIVSSDPTAPSFVDPANPDRVFNCNSFVYDPSDGRITVGTGFYSQRGTVQYRTYPGTITLSNS